MKKHNLTRIFVLVLSFALLIGSALVINAAAESTEPTDGTFGGISLVYKDTVSVVVEVKATKAQIDDGDVVVSYSVNGFNGKATYLCDSEDEGYVEVVTEGIAAYNFAEVITFSSTANNEQVEENRTYSVAEFLYKQLYYYGADEKYTALYNSIIAYGKAMSEIVEDEVNDITKSTLVFTKNADVKIGEKKFAFAPGASVEVTPVYNGELAIGKVLEGWKIKNNGEEEVVDTTFIASEVVEILEPVIGDEDATAFTLVNGGFENGLDGWTLVGNIGDVSSATHYWVGDSESAEGFAFGNEDEDNMFSAYAPGAEEGAVGTLTSSTFTVGGTGYVTFKLGAMKNGGSVYLDVVDAETDAVLVRYYNSLWAERTNDVKSGCTLIPYKADLSAYMGKSVYFRITDNATGDYGLFFADSFNTYHTTVPGDKYNLAAAGSIYELFNGGFELGDIRGWQNDGAPGLVTGADNYFDGTAYGKDGNFLYSGVQDQGGAFLEDRRGTLTSSVFKIGGTGFISFKLGGGGNALCYVQVIDASTNEVLARYHQQAQQGGTLIQYVADLSKYIGRTARIQVVDYASNDWGCVSFDNVVTYYPAGEALPEGAITANDIFHGVYDVTNGSFETGNLDGWNMNVTWSGDGYNTLGWVESSEHDAGWYTKNDGRKDGNYLFTFCKPEGTNCENNTGTLESSVFTLKKNGFVSFRFGGAGTRGVRIELVRVDGTVIATFYNEAPGKVDTEMYAYFYQYAGETTDCFFRVVDEQREGDSYRCFVVDDFRVNLESAPEGFIPAIQ